MLHSEFNNRNLVLNQIKFRTFCLSSLPSIVSPFDVIIRISSPLTYKLFPYVQTLQRQHLVNCHIVNFVFTYTQQIHNLQYDKIISPNTIQAWLKNVEITYKLQFLLSFNLSSRKKITRGINMKTNFYVKFTWQFSRIHLIFIAL